MVRIAVASLVIWAGLGAGVALAGPPTITEFTAGITAGSNTEQIAAGPDGNLWFTEIAPPRIGRITPAGVVTEFGGLKTVPTDIIAGPDGNLWFTEWGFSPHFAGVGKISPAGVILHEYSAGISYSQLPAIAAGPDGKLWFTEANLGRVAKITTAGAPTEYPLQNPLPMNPQDNAVPEDLAKGPDGNIWTTGSFAPTLFRATTAGVVTALGALPPTGSLPVHGTSSEIAAGPDGNLWYTDTSTNSIGRLTTAGAITEFAIPTPGAGPSGIAAGPDGNVWFTERNGNKIGRVTPDGVVTDYPVPTVHGGPLGIVAGPDGNIWFAEKDGSRIGRLTLPIPGDVTAVNQINPPGIVKAVPCRVPHLEGLTVSAAKAKLAKAKCRLGTIVRPRHAVASRLRVVHQLPSAGTKTTKAVSFSVAVPHKRKRHHVVSHRR